MLLSERIEIESIKSIITSVVTENIKLCVSFSYLNVFIEYLRFHVFNTLPHIVFSKDLFSPDEERIPENTEIKQAGSHVSLLCLNVSKEKQNKVPV